MGCPHARLHDSIGNQLIFSVGKNGDAEVLSPTCCVQPACLRSPVARCSGGWRTPEILSVICLQNNFGMHCL